MYLLIDMERLEVLYKHPDFATLDNVRHIECQQRCLITELNGKDTMFGSLTDLEIRILHRNLCGQSFAGYSRPHLVATVAKMCEQLPISNINKIEAELQAMQIVPGDEEYYKYAPGCAQAAPLGVLFKPPLQRTQQAVLPHIPEEPKAGPTPEFKIMMANYDAHKLAREAAKLGASTARETSSSPSTYVPPAGGSKTGRVWEIAEPIYQAATDKSNWKELRKAIVAACVAEGINESTASVQYGKWRKTKE